MMRCCTDTRGDGPGPPSREGGWFSVELLVAASAAIAISALGWKFYGDWMQRAENRQKAIAAVWEVSAFMARADTGPRDVPSIIQDGPGYQLPGGDSIGRGGACLLDSGDAGFASESLALQGVVRTCVPCDDSGAGFIPTGVLGGIPCVTGGVGLPKRCSTQAGMRAALPLNAGTDRATAPASSQLMQGIWIPADSLQDAVEIQHYIESDPQFGTLPNIAISRTGDPADPSTTAGLFLCL